MVKEPTVWLRCGECMGHLVMRGDTAICRNKRCPQFCRHVDRLGGYEFAGPIDDTEPIAA